MNRIQWIINGILLAAFLVLSIGLFYFKDKPRIAVIDNNKIIRLVSEKAGLVNKYGNQQQIFEGRLDTLKKELESDMTLYENGSLSPSQKKSLEQRMVKKRDDLMRYQATVSKKIQEDQVNDLKTALVPVDNLIDKYAKEKGYTLVIGSNDKSTVLYMKEGVDITEDIIKLIEQNSK